MNIEGIHIEQDKGVMIVFIEKFSKELQKLIRDQLAGIFHGFAEVTEMPNLYSYSFTLKSFLDRYNSKSEETKKGMIGELLSHILINALFDKLACLSILKNKEERSIKKGFDIIYYNEDSKSIWYTEVKSGRSENGSISSDNYNLELLKRSRDGIEEILNSRRGSIWESALIDVKLAVEEGSRRIKMRELLSKDIPNTKKADKKKNVILVSVLYHAMGDKMTLNEVLAFRKKIIGEKVFNSTVVFSIQKETYDKVAAFLLTESKTK
jgi:hypothetical protein